jgi:hypothetical protein
MPVPPPSSPGAAGSDGPCPPPPAPAGEARAPKRQRLENGKVLCRFEGCCKEMLSSNALRHERTHRGERPYKCKAPGCDETFTAPATLRYHTRVHNNDRPYVCTADGCEARHVNSSDLKRHYERNHTERAHQRRK